MDRSPQKHRQIIGQVNQWLEAAVIGLGLCPFARPVWQQKQIRFAVSEARSEEQLLLEIHDECKRLEENYDIETTLLIIPYHLESFDDFNEFLSLSDALLDEYHWNGIFQIASFHPRYRFANTHADDRENATNRSPYPILHLLRENRLSQAIASHPSPEEIPDKNIKRLNALDETTYQQIFALKLSVRE